jgi:hypothetical protein
MWACPVRHEKCSVGMADLNADEAVQSRVRVSPDCVASLATTR